MARVHGKDITSINIDNAGGTAADFKAETISLDFSASAETHDTTTIGDSFREFTSGLKGGDDVSHTFMYNNTSTTGIWAVYTGRLGISNTLDFTDGDHRHQVVHADCGRRHDQMHRHPQDQRGNYVLVASITTPSGETTWQHLQSANLIRSMSSWMAT